MTELRQWQSECTERALEVFHDQTHFLCHATPGAGKTVMVASVAKALLERNKIDFALCFSPSRTVAQGVEATFSKMLGRNFNGQIGAAGGSYTYQSMSTLPAQLWQVLSEYRVFVVLDEIHHCHGSSWEELPMGNSWGRTILDRIQGKARYTMALSGTPWRTDDNPIVLSRYARPDGQLCCDYTYGLNRAVSDGVCREPKIVLADNREINLSSSELGLKTYSSIRETLENSHITYPDFLFKEEVIDHVLSEASKKLTEVRKHSPAAGGLVVAATVDHAEQIATRLAALGETPLVVTYQTPSAHQMISDFKRSSAPWIISVGMISEGTDIPRLQVCCHLSRIRTELHFRQVLGRILRKPVGESADLGGWLYVLAEPNITAYARRIDDDLPGHQVTFSSPKASSGGSATSALVPACEVEDMQEDWKLDDGIAVDWSGQVPQQEARDHIALSVSDQYWSEVLSLFGAGSP